MSAHCHKKSRRLPKETAAGCGRRLKAVAKAKDYFFFATGFLAAAGLAAGLATVFLSAAFGATGFLTAAFEAAGFAAALGAAFFTVFLAVAMMCLLFVFGSGSDTGRRPGERPAGHRAHCAAWTVAFMQHLPLQAPDARDNMIFANKLSRIN